MKTPNYPHPILAKEGWPFIAVSVLITLVSFMYFGIFFSILCLIISIFIIQFFRDPARSLPHDFDNHSIVSPADGKIVFLGIDTNPYTNQSALKISVFMNVFNVHSNRCPIDGNIEAIHYFEGSFLNASLDKSSLQNERNAVILNTKTGHNITFVQIAGLVARRILCYAKVGDALSVGQRYGFIRFGSRVDVYLPAAAIAKVQLGQKVSACSSLLAQLPPIIQI